MARTLCALAAPCVPLMLLTLGGRAHSQGKQCYPGDDSQILQTSGCLTCNRRCSICHEQKRVCHVPVEYLLPELLQSLVTAYPLLRKLCAVVEVFAYGKGTCSWLLNTSGIVMVFVRCHLSGLRVDMHLNLLRQHSLMGAASASSPETR